MFATLFAFFVEFVGFGVLVVCLDWCFFVGQFLYARLRLQV